MPDELSLQHRRSLPPGGRSASLSMADGWAVRHIVWGQGEKGRPPLLFCGGRADFIEKYAETLWHWRARGHAIMAFDMRGYGLSGRASRDPMRDFNHDFAQLVRDYDALYAHARDVMGAPPVPIAHSMGGHILLRWLIDTPRAVPAAVVLSPMLGLGDALRTWVFGRISDVMARLQGADHWAFGQGAYDAELKNARRAKILTGSAERYADEHWWIEANPHLAIGGVSWGWLREAARSIAYVQSRKRLARIQTPLCMLMGTAEKLVDPRAAAWAARHIKGAQFHWIAEGRHELLRDSDAVQHASWQIIDDFLEGLR